MEVTIKMMIAGLDNSTYNCIRTPTEGAHTMHWCSVHCPQQQQQQEEEEEEDFHHHLRLLKEGEPTASPLPQYLCKHYGCSRRTLGKSFRWCKVCNAAVSIFLLEQDVNSMVVKLMDVCMYVVYVVYA